MDKMLKDIFTHKIKNTLAKDHGPRDYTVKWLALDAVEWPSGARGHVGRLTVSADGWRPVTYKFVADSADWSMSV